MNAILYAFLAAVFHAINIPASKVLLAGCGADHDEALILEHVRLGKATRY